MIKLDNLTDGMMAELDRLTKGPTAADFAKFEIVLQSQFRLTQILVHRITGSLALSGKINSSSSNATWKGEITYGGSSTGIHNPVDYAEYERERDGNHDFLSPVEALGSEYVQAMEAFLKG